MKKNMGNLLWLTVLCVFGLSLLTGCKRVYEGDCYIDTNADLRDFLLGGYTEITGDLYIGKFPLNEYSLIIKSPEFYQDVFQKPMRLVDVLSYMVPLKNLNGLESLKTIGGSLHVGYIGYLSITKDNPSLENIDGLRNLEYVGGDIDFRGSNALTNLDGFKNLTTVGGKLNIDRLPLLTSLNGLENLDTIGDGLYITGNKNLEGLDGLFDVTLLEGDLHVFCNSETADLDGETLKDNLITEGWSACWDLTCDDEKNPVCP